MVVMIVKPMATLPLEVRSSVDGARLMILIKGRPKRCRIGAIATNFVLVVVGIVQIIVVKGLLLSPDTPSSVGETSEQ